MRWSALAYELLLGTALALASVGFPLLAAEDGNHAVALVLLGLAAALLLLGIAAWIHDQRASRSAGSVDASPLPREATRAYRESRPTDRSAAEIGRDLQKTIDGLTALLRNRSHLAPGLSTRLHRQRVASGRPFNDDVVGVLGRNVHGDDRWQRGTMVAYGRDYREPILDYFYEACAGGYLDWGDRKRIHVASSVPQLWGMIDHIGQRTMQLMGHADGS